MQKKTKKNYDITLLKWFIPFCDFFSHDVKPVSDLLKSMAVSKVL